MAFAVRARMDRAFAVRARMDRAFAVRVGVVAAALVAGPLALPGGAADNTFQAQTTAVAVHVTITQEPATSIITASLLDDAVGYAAGTFDTSGDSEAVASPAFPGRLVVQGPQLLCSELFDCPAQPPPYPLIADASYPRRPHDRASGGGNTLGDAGLSATPLSAAATATQQGNRATSAAGAVTALPGTGSEVHVDASSVSSEIQRRSDGLVVHVESTLHGITIAGAVHIASLQSVDTIVLNPGAEPVSHPHVTLGAVDVGGVPATIDNRGLHVAGQHAGGIAQDLQNSGIRIRTLTVDRTETRNGAQSDAAGLRVDLQLPVNGVPYIPNPLPPFPPPFDQIPTLPGINANGTYVAQITLGGVGAAAGYGTQPTFTVEGVQPGGPVTPVAGKTGGGNGGSGRVLAGNRFVARLGNAPPAAPPGPAVAPPQTSVFRGVLDALSKRALEIVYAALALGTAAIFIGWRVSAAGRRGSRFRLSGRGT